MAGEAQVAVQPRPKPQQQQGLATADPTVFRLQFLGSVEVEEENGRKRRKRLKKHMVEEAVTKIKVPLSTFVDIQNNYAHYYTTPGRAHSDPIPRTYTYPLSYETCFFFCERHLRTILCGDIVFLV